ncbi:kinase-like domain-containing protein, partial [Gymnopilus junonius]
TKKRHDPKMIGLWKVGRTLGQGFSGHVRIARHSRTGQYAAIKIISKTSPGSRVSLNRLADEVEHNLLAVEREIVVMKLIDHPNVMKLYDVWETSSSLYLVLEYVQGGELFEYLCDKGRRPTSEVISYFQQIICAVAHCHCYNIAHRDLKLENILIDQESNIKIADFGMATWQDDSRGKLLRTSFITGQPYNGSTSDIWSCGIILYALLAAKLPFDDDDCPTLLQKITLGKFDMPNDIDPRAQDLLSRMLNVDPNKRITMAEILRHPFFVSQPLKDTTAVSSEPNMDLIARPIGSLSAIDPDIFANLRTLWRGMSDAELIASLMTSERNWQKGIYHLLSNYRKKYLTLRQREDEERFQARLERRKSRQAPKPSDSSLPPRDGPPTPRRARKGGGRISPSESTGQEQFPVISLSVPSPEIPTTPSGNADPRLIAPQLENEKIQQFCQQIAEHLNALQIKAGEVMDQPMYSRTPTPSSTESFALISLLNIPEMLSTPLRGENGSRYRNSADNSPIQAHSTPFTRPLTLRRKDRNQRPINSPNMNNKENLHITQSDIVNRQSPLARHTATMADENFLQTYETPFIRSAFRFHKNRISSGPPSPMFSEAGSSFSFPSPIGSPRRSWLDNVFKFKPATYTLLSRQNVHTTRVECRRLLMQMDMIVSLEESEKIGLLRCRSKDVKDSGNMMLGLKSVKFRVEMRWPTPELCQEGYLVSLLLVHEKGPLNAFKAIYHKFVSMWTLGHPARSTSVSSGTPSSLNAVGGNTNR